MKNKKGFTLIELMIVVAIIGVLAGIGIPMYNSNVNKAKLQEAVDSLGAMKDEVCTFAGANGHPPGNLHEGPPDTILSTLGIQVPQSRGQAGAGGRKWTYSTQDTGC
jgi:prepilin-type N-terminal cleavage/methylation domain-containing protein